MKRIAEVVLLLLSVVVLSGFASMGGNSGPPPPEGAGPGPQNPLESTDPPLHPSQEGTSEKTKGQPAPAPLPGGDEAKKIVAAKVNGVEITMDSVMKVMGRLGPHEGGESVSHGADGEIKQKALDILILRELAYQNALARGIKADPDKIEASLTNLKQSLGGEEKFREFLERQKLTETDLTSQIEKKLVTDLILRREVLDRIAVSEEEMMKEYEEQKGKFVTAEKMVIVDIVFFLNPDEADSQRKAEDTLRKINEDKDKNPWNLAPDDSFSVRERQLKESPEKDIYETAKKLKVGELSGVFVSSGTLHIVKLNEYTPRKEPAFEEVKNRIEKDLKARARKKRLEEWESELKKEAKIEIIEHSPQ